MPCLEITMPRMDAGIKARLAAELTREFDAATGFGEENFCIRFSEYGPGEAACGGRLWDGEGVTYLHFMLYCPRLRRAAKQQVAEGLTRAFVSCVGKPDWKPVIHIDEHAYDNICVEGQLLSDLEPECAALDFYYPMPDRPARVAAV